MPRITVARPPRHRWEDLDLNSAVFYARRGTNSAFVSHLYVKETQQRGVAVALEASEQPSKRFYFPPSPK
jgi:hypothetical protein